jgi:nucleoside-diphosphate-sugar epimerase
MKRVLLTGSSGFIGRYAVSELLEKDYEIHALYNKTKPVEKKHVIYHKVDLFDYSQQQMLMREIEPTHLLHFAWYAVPGLYWNSLENFRWVQTSLELLKLFCQYGGQRAVLAGTCAEYDWSFGYCSEGVTPTCPSTVYGTCKNSLREMMAQISKQTGLSSAWGRIFYLYGPFEDRSRLIPYVVNSLLQNKQAKCSHGHQIRDFLYVQDVASAFVALLESDVMGPVNIASGQPVTLKNVIYKIADKLDRYNLIQLGALPAQDNDPRVLIADIRKLSEEVRWQPKFDLDVGLEQTIAWWKNTPYV